MKLAIACVPRAPRSATSSSSRPRRRSSASGAATATSRSSPATSTPRRASTWARLGTTNSTPRPGRSLRFSSTPSASRCCRRAPRLLRSCRPRTHCSLSPRSAEAPSSVSFSVSFFFPPPPPGVRRVRLLPRNRGRRVRQLRAGHRPRCAPNPSPRPLSRTPHLAS